MSKPEIGGGSPEKKRVRSGREYFEEEKISSHTVEEEDDGAIKIDIRPGLLAEFIAAGVADRTGKIVSYELKKGKNFTITPGEARDILEKMV